MGGARVHLDACKKGRTFVLALWTSGRRRCGQWAGQGSTSAVQGRARTVDSGEAGKSVSRRHGDGWQPQHFTVVPRTIRIPCRANTRVGKTPTGLQVRSRMDGPQPRSKKKADAQIIDELCYRFVCKTEISFCVGRKFRPFCRSSLSGPVMGP